MDSIKPFNYNESPPSYNNIVSPLPPPYNSNNYTITDEYLNKKFELINIIERKLIYNFHSVGLSYDSIIDAIKKNYIIFLHDNRPIIKEFAISIHNYNNIKKQYDNVRITINNTNFKTYIDTQLEIIKNQYDYTLLDLNDTLVNLVDNNKLLNSKILYLTEQHELLYHREYINCIIYKSNHIFNNYMRKQNNYLNIDYFRPIEYNIPIIQHICNSTYKTFNINLNCNIKINSDIFREVVIKIGQFTELQLDKIYLDAIHACNNINEFDLIEYNENTNNSNFSKFLLQQFYSYRTIEEPIINKAKFWIKCIDIWNNFTDEQKNIFN